jgi:hypothetical protein
MINSSRALKMDTNVFLMLIVPFLS